MKDSNREIKINGTVYCFTNEINGHQYVGITKNKLKIRLGTHYGLTASGAPLLVKAFKKYGKEKIKVSVIDTASTLGELHDKEIYWIEKLNTKAPKGYNILPGGLNNEAAAAANQEPVRCVTNNKDYVSLEEAGKDTGIARYLIGFNCVGRQDTAGGMEFEYIDPNKRNKASEFKKERKEKRLANKVQIRNCNTGEIYFGFTDAQDKTNISKRIIQHCVMGETEDYKGIKFEYVDIFKQIKTNNKLEQRKRK